MTDLLEQVANLLGAERYSQHAICLTNDPLIMTVFVAAHALIWAAYFTMGFALITNRLVIAQLNPMALGMYGAFIFLCGCTHFMAIIVLFTGIYRLEVAILALTAAVSAVTAYFTVLEIWQAE